MNKSFFYWQFVLIKGINHFKFELFINITSRMNAVEVRGGYKYYGKDKDPKIILNRLDMNVSHGSMWVFVRSQTPHHCKFDFLASVKNFAKWAKKFQGCVIEAITGENIVDNLVFTRFATTFAGVIKLCLPLLDRAPWKTPTFYRGEFVYETFWHWQLFLRHLKSWR